MPAMGGEVPIEWSNDVTPSNSCIVEHPGKSVEQGDCHGEARPRLARRPQQRRQATSEWRPEGRLLRPGRSSRRQALARFPKRWAGLFQLCRTLGKRWQWLGTCEGKTRSELGW